MLTRIRIVEQEVTSALVLEDDVDWDVRIKAQLSDFAKASRLLVQPLRATPEEFLDPTMSQPITHVAQQDFIVGDYETIVPTTSPYGDTSRWDLLWLGHCGCRFPRASDGNVPLGRAVIINDTTVPRRENLDMELGNNELIEQYPDHTRVVSRARVNSCTLAYGVSQRGARRFLYEVGIHKMSDPNDTMFRYICDGVEGRHIGICLTVQPQLFQHHRPVGPRSAFSDISDHGSGYNEHAETKNIMKSVRLNFEPLINGDENLVNSYPIV